MQEMLMNNDVFIYREAFAGFDPSIVSKMGEKEIVEIASNKELTLPEGRVRCIVDNAKCIIEASFSRKLINVRRSV